jgi:hypothetical protein
VGRVAVSQASKAEPGAPANRMGTTSIEDLRLYHYTTVESFANILKTRVLWASHIGYLNDTSEQSLIPELIRKRIKARLQNPECPNRKTLEKVDTFVSSPISKDVFVVSFSKDGGDRLSQWRGYSGSAGVSIGFNPSELEKRCNTFTTENYKHPTDGIGAILREVKYIKATGDKHSDVEIDSTLDFHIAVAEMESPLTPSETFNRELSYTSCDLKDAAFGEELESRIVILDFSGDSNLLFRTRKSLLAPYREFSLGTQLWPLISKVTIGPSPHKEETTKAIKRMIGDDRIEVVESLIPYRDW